MEMGSPAWKEGELQGLFIQLLSLNPFLLCFHLSLHFSAFYPLPMVPFRLSDLFLYIVLGAAPLMSCQLPGVGGRAPVTRGGASGSQGPLNVSSQWSDQRPSLYTILQGAWPCQSPPHLLTLSCPSSAMVCNNCNGLDPNSPTL